MIYLSSSSAYDRDIILKGKNLYFKIILKTIKMSKFLYSSWNKLRRNFQTNLIWKYILLLIRRCKYWKCATFKSLTFVIYIIDNFNSKFMNKLKKCLKRSWKNYMYQLQKARDMKDYTAFECNRIWNSNSRARFSILVFTFDDSIKDLFYQFNWKFCFFITTKHKSIYILKIK